MQIKEEMQNKSPSNFYQWKKLYNRHFTQHSYKLISSIYKGVARKVVQLWPLAWPHVFAYMLHQSKNKHLTSAESLKNSHL